MTLTVTPQESTESTSIATLEPQAAADSSTQISNLPEVVEVKFKSQANVVVTKVEEAEFEADSNGEDETVFEAESSTETEPDAEPEVTFEHFGLKESILRVIKEAGFTSPSPIQLEALPVVLSGRDVIARAQTGTGKTAAFGMP